MNLNQDSSLTPELQDLVTNDTPSHADRPRQKLPSRGDLNRDPSPQRQVVLVYLL